MSFASSHPDAAAAVVSPGATDGSLYATFDETAAIATPASDVGQLSVSIRKRVQRTTK
jgi:hypothetical protein